MFMKNKIKALFLDRDGVINHDGSGYTHSADSFIFIDGIFEVCRVAQSLGYLIVVVTNQAGIARGYFSESDFIRLTDWMTEQFRINGVSITDVLYCPFHPVHGIGPYLHDSFDRKPNPGMLLRAQEKFDIAMEASVIIGDSESDMVAAFRAGVTTRILFPNEKTQLHDANLATHTISVLQDALCIISV